MIREMKLTILSSALAILALPSVAQDSTSSAQNPPAAAQSAPTATTTTPPATPTTPAATPTRGKKKRETIDQTKDIQQDRITQGLNSGQLTAGEAANLENKEAKINQEQKQMQAADHGGLTAADKAKLRQQQNQLNGQIYKDKHNAAEQNNNPTATVDKHAERQQDRIADGLKKDQLTAGQAANLENKEAGINREIAKDRAANHNSLTPAERAQINRQQAQLSKQIYKEKRAGRKQAH